MIKITVILKWKEYYIFWPYPYGGQVINVIFVATSIHHTSYGFEFNCHFGMFAPDVLKNEIGSIKILILTGLAQHTHTQLREAKLCRRQVFAWTR